MRWRRAFQQWCAIFRGIRSWCATGARDWWRDRRSAGRAGGRSGKATRFGSGGAWSDSARILYRESDGPLRAAVRRPPGGRRCGLLHRRRKAGRAARVTMRTLIKQGALRALRSAGLFRIAAGSKMRRERLLILCYHGISLRDEERWEELLYISPRLFRQRLETLRRFGARVLELGEALRRLRERSLPPRSVVLTFDDGFYDFHRNALPLLEEFGYPCTLYLTTHYCRYRFPIFNLVVPYVLWKSGRPAMDLSRFGAAGEVGIA